MTGTLEQLKANLLDSFSSELVAFVSYSAALPTAVLYWVLPTI